MDLTSEGIEMSGKEWFSVLGIVGLAIFMFKTFLNPRCKWCGAALQAVAIGQRLACPSCGRFR